MKALIISACLCLVVASFVSGNDFQTLNRLRSKTSLHDQEASVTKLLERVIGARSSDFVIDINPSIGPENRDTYLLRSVGSKMSITGTSGVAAAMGFYKFLKYYCGGQFTWAGQQTTLPVTLPLIPAPGVKVTTNDQFRYYQNVCTSSYSFAWWDWSRWEREIDWMALQGINLPLAFTGQEAIFQRVYMQLGFTMEDLQAHFGGPAFLTWARMGNINGWGGPLPQSWIDTQLTLQHQILDRMRSLGMTPILPGFAGHVPAAIKRVFPKANVSRLGTWGNFKANYSETYLLDFKDPLFAKIGSTFITEMEAEFGIDHFYNADSFNEMTPGSSDPGYLASSALGVYNAMLAADPEAVWVMQAWLFRNTGFWKPPQMKALLNAVPKGRMLLLDLSSILAPIYTSSQSYYGQPFIWGMLHNFGGTLELYGVIDKVNEASFPGRWFPNSTMVGIGLTPEGINQNEVIYELMNEMGWRRSPVNLTEWVYNFQRGRYETNNLNTAKAWDLLKGSVYNCTDGHFDLNYALFTKRPTLTMGEDVWYKPESLFSAWDNMIQAASTGSFQNSVLFKYDLVDITRNSLQLITIQHYQDMMTAYKQKNLTSLSSAGSKLIGLLTDLDLVLASDEHFLFGKWVQDALSFATNAEETKLYNMNARNQVTLWGPLGEIQDYAAKQWAGLVGSYHKPRWQLFWNALMESLKSGAPFSQDKFNQDVFKTIEQPFSYSSAPFPSQPTGDPIQIATQLHGKYRPTTNSEFYHNLAGRRKLSNKRPVRSYDFQD